MWLLGGYYSRWLHSTGGGTWSLGKLPRPCHTGISRLDTSALVVETVWVYGARCGNGFYPASESYAREREIRTKKDREAPRPDRSERCWENDIVCHQEPSSTHSSLAQ